jgi:hypothetical protein
LFGGIRVRIQDPNVNNTPTADSGSIIKPEGGDETRPVNAYVSYIIKVKP